MSSDASDLPTQPLDSDAVADDQLLEQPTQIGPYRILRLLGEGGMGVVYDAEQTKPIKRRVALKLMKIGMDTKEVVARFDAERQALAVMDHPGIAKVLDAGASETGRPYFVMELVRGVSLTEYCNTFKLATRERLQLFIGVCQAVHHAHQKGVIHRDLKPSNILVSDVDGKPTPKIIDFGIAKAIGQRLTEHTLVTSYGQAMGTPAYMSPEQAEMSGLDVDTRTDIYALGVMLYELLVGSLPVDPSELGIPAFIAQLVMRETDPPTPSTRLSRAGREQSSIAQSRHTDPATLQRELKGDLDWIVMKAMEKDRTRRYEGASELAADLRRYLDEEPVAARPPSPGYRLGKFVRRHRAGVVAGSVVVLGLLAGTVLATLGLLRATRAEQVASQEAAAAREVSDFLVGLFAVSDPGEARGSTITAREILDQGAVQVAGELEDQPLTRARFMHTIGQVYLNLGLFNAAHTMADSALMLRRAAYGERHLDVASTMHLLAEANRRQGRYREAEPLYREALSIQEEMLEPDDPDLAWSYHSLGVWYDEQGRYAEAESLFTLGLEAREEALGPDHPDVAGSLQSLGIVYYNQGRLEEAEPLFERALAIKERELGPDHFSVANALGNLAIIYTSLGKYEEVEPLYRRVVEIYEVNFGPEHPDVASALNNLAAFYEHVGRYEEAEPLYERSLALWEEALGPDHPDVAIGLHNLGNLYRNRGDYERAAPYYRRSQAIWEGAFGSDHPYLVESHKEQAVLYGALGDTRRAEREHRRAVAMAERLYGVESPQVADLLEAYTAFLRESDRQTEADSLEARAAGIREGQGGP